MRINCTGGKRKNILEIIILREDIEKLIGFSAFAYVVTFVTIVTEKLKYLHFVQVHTRKHQLLAHQNQKMAGCPEFPDGFA